MKKLKERLKRLPLFYSIGIFVVMGIVMGLFVSNVLVTRARVVGDSMIPTYYEGDNIILCRVLSPERGDLVAVHGDEKNLIKRVIGMPGDTIQISEGSVFINGEYYEEPYINNHNTKYIAGLAEEAITLKENEYFIMGDNRAVSKDSREIGPVTKDQIIGVVIGEL